MVGLGGLHEEEHRRAAFSLLARPGGEEEFHEPGRQCGQILPADGEGAERIEQPFRHGKQHVGPGERIDFRHGEDARIADGGRQAAGIALQHGDAVALFQKMERCGAAHQAAADDTDMRHAVPLRSCRCCGRGGRLRRTIDANRPPVDTAMAAAFRRLPRAFCRGSCGRGRRGRRGSPSKGRWSAPGRCR